MRTSRKGKRKTRGGSKKLCLFQRQQIEGKRIRSFNKLKEIYLRADRWFICTLNNSINKTNISFLNNDPHQTKYFLIILSMSNIHPRIDISLGRVSAASGAELDVLSAFLWSTAGHHCPMASGLKTNGKGNSSRKNENPSGWNLKLVLLSSNKNT